MTLKCGHKGTQLSLPTVLVETKGNQVLSLSSQSWEHKQNICNFKYKQVIYKKNLLGSLLYSNKLAPIIFLQIYFWQIQELTIYGYI